MKVLIIGGTRFMGYHLVRRLLADGHAVTLFNRGKTPDDFGDDVGRIEGDRSDRTAFRKRLGRESFDGVVDMIAYTAEDGRSAVETFGGNVGHVVHISTAAVYLVTRDYPCPLREEDYDRPTVPRPPGDAGVWDYGAGKRGCEDVLREAHARSGFPATIVRPPIVGGERDYTLRMYSYLLRMRDGRPILLPDGGQSVFSLVYQGDVVRAIAENLGNPRSFGRAYNLAQTRALTLKDFLERSARIMGTSPEFVPVSYELLKSAGWRASHSPYFARRPLALDTRRAEAELGYSSTDLDAWLEKTIRWFDGWTGGRPDEYASREDEVRISRDYQSAVQGMIGTERKKGNH